MAYTQDQKIIRYGTPDGHQVNQAPVGANVQLYHGEVALLAASGGAVTQGYVKSSATVASGDIVIGMVDKITGGTGVATSQGILGGTTDGAISIDCQTGTFLFQSGTGSDQLSETTAGTTVYLIGQASNNGPPLAGATSGGSSRPVLGIQLPVDPSVPSGLYPVKLTTVGGP